MNNTMWVLTKSYNDYNQHGDYFVAVFRDKPTLKQLGKVLQYEGEYLQHVLNGGGRLTYEDSWYYLNEVEFE